MKTIADFINKNTPLDRLSIETDKWRIYSIYHSKQSAKEKYSALIGPAFMLGIKIWDKFDMKTKTSTIVDFIYNESLNK